MTILLSETGEANTFCCGTSSSRKRPRRLRTSKNNNNNNNNNNNCIQKLPLYKQRKTTTKIIISAVVSLMLILQQQQQHCSAASFFRCRRKRTRLTWVNGIGYNLEHMNQQQHIISKMFGYKRVEFCHNPTSMSNEDDLIGYLGDLTQAGTQRYLGRVTNEVDLLVTHLKEAVRSVGKNGKVIHIAHSQGALITALASQKLSIKEMNQIEIIVFGGAAAIQRTSDTPFSRCINYYSVNDPLLWVVPKAEQTLRSGFLQSEGEFCFLVPRIGDPIADHQLLGPTYKQALQWEGQRYKNKYQNIIQRTIYLILMLIIEFIRYLKDWFYSNLVVPVLIPNFEKAKKIIIIIIRNQKTKTNTPDKIGTS